MSLSTWFRDYIYIPLGGSRGSLNKKIRNVFIIFLVSGFWHGANWTFIIWGGLNALYFLPLLLTNKNRVNTDIVAQNKILPNVREVFQMLTTFFITLLAWVFFRANSVTHAIDYLQGMLDLSLFSKPTVLPYTVLFLVLVFMVIEWLGRHGQFALERIDKVNKPVRWSIYLVLIMVMFLFTGEEQAFIYFQF